MMSSGGPSAPTPAPPLKRGKACLTCRFLKIRCDGARPVCTPCATQPKEDPCEYADVPGRSRYRNLEETIASLKLRVHELESENGSLREALNQAQSPESPVLRRRTMQLQTPDASDYSGSPECKLEDTPPVMTTLEEVFQTLPHSDSGADKNAWTAHCIGEMMSSFAACVTQFGFFLDKDHFGELAILPPGDPTRPCEAVIAAVCLWGCHLSSSDSPFRTLEDSVLKVCLYQCSTTLLDDETNPRRVLHTVQSEVLLSYFFFRRGLFIEAKNHAASTASLVTGSGMHNILSITNQPLRELQVLEDGHASYLPPGRNAPETGELINGFWAAYTIANQINSASSTADCADIFDVPHLTINCPWPLDIMSYRNGILPPRGSNTIQAFLYSDPFTAERDARHDSFSTMAAKATVLLRDVTVATDGASPSADYMARMTFLITDYRTTLPPVLLSSPELRTIYLARALTASAHLRLHKEKALQKDGGDLALCLGAIQDLFLVYTECDLRTLDCVSPVLGGLWKDGCIFIALALRNGTPLPLGIVEEMRSLYTFGKGIIEAHAQAHDGNTLMQYQLTQLPQTM